MSVKSFLDAAVHPRCQAKRRSVANLIFLIVMIMLFFLITFTIWPSPWILLIAPVFGIIIITHPVCLLTHHDHKGRSI